MWLCLGLLTKVLYRQHTIVSHSYSLGICGCVLAFRQRYCTSSIPLFTTATVLIYVVVSWPLDKGIVQAAYHCLPQLQSWYMWLCLGLWTTVLYRQHTIVYHSYSLDICGCVFAFRQRYCTGSIPLFTTATVLIYVVVSLPLDNGIVQAAYHCLPQLQS